MSHSLSPGQPIIHERLGDGVVVAMDDGYARVFFGTAGQQTVPLSSLRPQMSWDEQVIASLRPATADAIRRLYLAIEARALPLRESAIALTAAKVDLLPHQIVLTHRVATASPRRFLIADDVGLGKTIETALVLRELASRGELKRALLVVPAGLVENWRRELNDIFHLDFEVFGSQGDVTDRTSNAFARHDRLIASIDALKRPARLARLAEAPPWDVVVFDEAHHLTATRTGNKVKKTDNYRLGEQLRDHCRDLIMLSATPHQGDHFRFLALARLLHPTLFRDEQDMLDNRHRLNAVVIRRTKADVCYADGSPVFARRQVHSHVFHLSEPERVFYDALTTYLQEGYDLAAARGGRARALGFVMTVFQKIASSSFAAVRRTLERRLLSLTLHEALVCDAAMDVSGRDALLREARHMLIEMNGLDTSPVGQAEADRLLADARVRLLKKLRASSDDEQFMDSEGTAGEESAALLVQYALPEERQRIRDLLASFPSGEETKTREVVRALREIWSANPGEKVIIFSSYLGSVAGLQKAIESSFPGIGIEVLKGGDPGAKLAVERRFRRPDGPRVLISTAAGREGINLQFARIIFNHDLPWNPMDLEQRIGRIHRYGQRDTAQVYHFVVADTIEGQVFLLLEQKIKAVAAALGKVDARGEVAEDLRSQILGQLGERVSFNHLYQQALSDPTLLRTNQELEVALRNAEQAREVVGQLFQDLEPFRLEDYRDVADADGVERLHAFVIEAAHQRGWIIQETSPTRLALVPEPGNRVLFTVDRDEAVGDDGLQLLGLEHPLIADLLAWASELGPEGRALIVDTGGSFTARSIWEVQVQNPNGQRSVSLFDVRVDRAGIVACHPYDSPDWLELVRPPFSSIATRPDLARVDIPARLRATLVQDGRLDSATTYNFRLLAWIASNEC